MYIPIFIEINNEEKPVYQNDFMAFYNRVQSNNGFVIASKEYCDEIPDKSNEKIIQIPVALMNEVDCNLLQKEDRKTMFSIQKNENLEQWLIDTLREMQGEIEGIMIRGRYSAVLNAAKKLGVNVYFAADGMDAQQLMFEKVTKNLDDKEKELEQLQVANEKQRKDIHSKDEYIQQLQVRVNNLENELYKKGQKLEQNNNELKSNEALLEKMENDKYLYLKLYKELLKELDVTKVELLELKRKVK